MNRWRTGATFIGFKVVTEGTAPRKRVTLIATVRIRQPWDGTEQIKRVFVNVRLTPLDESLSRLLGHLLEWLPVKARVENLDPKGIPAILEAAAQRIREIHLNTCRKCGGDMAPSTAIMQTYTGSPDFGASDEIVTFSPGGSGKLIPCRKCVDCGWSVTA